MNKKKIICNWFTLSLMILIVNLSIQVNASTIFESAKDRYGTINNRENKSESQPATVSPINPSYNSYVPPAPYSATTKGNTSNAYLSKKKIVLYCNDSTTVTLKNSSKKVQWSTSNKSIVDLKTNGNKVIVTGIAIGTCVIRAKYRGRVYTCHVICKKNPKNTIFLKKCKWEVPASFADAIAIPVTIGMVSVNAQANGGYLKFTAPKEGLYSFKISKIIPQNRYYYWVGGIIDFRRKSEYGDYLVDDVYLNGRTSLDEDDSCLLVGYRKKGYNKHKKKYKEYLKSNTGTFPLLKDETVYIFIDLPVACSLRFEIK